MVLAEEEKRELLQIARSTLQSYLGQKVFPVLQPRSTRLKDPAGAFVTLEKKNVEPRLRGCIGHMGADKPLCVMVQQMAVQAATGDPRFPPVTAEELEQIQIEISVLSPLKLVTNPAEIQIGEHGVLVSRGLQRGVLLPQVATREGWNREEFLGYTCLKAGLLFDSWRKGDVRIEVFSADVFGEGGLKQP